MIEVGFILNNATAGRARGGTFLRILMLPRSLFIRLSRIRSESRRH